MFEIFDIDNKKINCEVLFTFSENNKNFIVYNDQDNDILASYFETNGELTRIFPITDDNDYDIVDRELKKRMYNNEEQ